MYNGVYEYATYIYIYYIYIYIYIYNYVLYYYVASSHAGGAVLFEEQTRFGSQLTNTNHMCEAT